MHKFLHAIVCRNLLFPALSTHRGHGVVARDHRRQTWEEIEPRLRQRWDHVMGGSRRCQLCSGAIFTLSLPCAKSGWLQQRERSDTYIIDGYDIPNGKVRAQPTRRIRHYSTTDINA